MSTIITDIFTAIKSEVTTQFPLKRELRRIFDVDQNEHRLIEDSFAVRHLEQVDVNESGITKAYTDEQRFEIILTEKTNDRLSDAAIQTQINSLYDNISELKKSFYFKKLGLPSTVLKVDNINVDEPELLNGREFLLIRMNIRVRYRELLN